MTPLPNRPRDRVIARTRRIVAPLGHALHGQAYASFGGAVVAAGFLAMSLTPSLLPRTWVVQGLISGVSVATGYAIGAILSRLVRRVVPGIARPRVRRIAWYALVGTGAPLIGVLAYQSSRWQRDLYALMGEPRPARLGYLRAGLIACAVFLLLLAVARSLRAAARTLAEFFAHYLRPRAARVAGAVLVALVFMGTLDALVYDPGMSFAFAASSSINDELSPKVSPPTSDTRSGGPGSAVSWASLGLEGRAFVAGGPSPGQLRAFNGITPKPPVRVYAGLRSAPTIPAEADLALRELLRTGAFSRQVLCVITTTGTGWVDPRAVDALEYLYNGDTALVAIQYSVLPSWLTYVVERKKAESAGRQLFDAVYGYWTRLPARHRPRLLLFGESLGTLGGEAAMDDMRDLSGRVDGALLAGPMAANRLWSSLVAGRDRGTTEVEPRYQQGRIVRFAANGSDLTDVTGPWPGPRVVYLQHASDPITWWSPLLALRRPDWLREARGPDVLPAMRWYPFVTFWQVTADLVLAQDTTLGHGHRYGGELATAWVAIASPPGWTDRDTARLVHLIDTRG
jgi:uncharacterized membrane protein